MTVTSVEASSCGSNGKRKAEAVLASEVEKRDSGVSAATTNRTDDGAEETKASESDDNVSTKLVENHPKETEEGNRPLKKPKADTDSPIAGNPTGASASTSSSTAQDEIAAKLGALAKKSTLSDYEKCSIFPQKLMQLLKNDEAPDAIWWLEDGESFAIEQEQFTKVMNKVSRTSKKKVKLDSILRNLYRWGFKKLKDRDLPPSVLAYSHPKFKRDACVELQTFSKKPAEGSSSADGIGASGATGVGVVGGTFRPGMAAPPSALARALSARAQEGYGDNWNEEGAADNKTSMMMMHAQQQQQQHGHGHLHPNNNPYAAVMIGNSAGATTTPEEQHRLMMQSMMLQQHQQQRQMLLQQELLYHEQQQRHQQALLLEAAAAERAAMGHYAAQRFAGVPPSGFSASSSSPSFPHQPTYPF